MFAMGAAEAVSDPALTEAPLAEPGTVIKLSRGSAADHLAAEADRIANNEPSTATVRKRSKPKPLPSRARVEAADAALTDAKTAYERDLEKVDAEAAILRDRKAAIEAKHEAAIRALAAKRDSADAAYQKAVDRWRAADA